MICVPNDNQPTIFGDSASIGFCGTEDKSDDSYKNLINIMSNQNFPSSLSAKTWIDNNNYWSSHWTSQMITDQLVLYYDASDLTSFRGEPTTNLVPYNNYSNKNYNTRYTANSWGGDYADVWYFSEGGYMNLPYKKMIKTSGGTGGSFIDDNNGIMIESGKTYTLSCYMKSSYSVTLNPYSYCLNRTADNYYKNGNEITVTTEWKRFTWTFTTTNTENGNYALRGIIYIDDNLPLEVYWCGYQIEQKSHSTPFIPGTRGTSFATGGGWCDLSGNENHGTLNYTESIENTGYLQNSDNTSNFFAISIPDSTILNDTFTKTTGGWTIEEIIWTNSCTYPEADAGTVVSNNGYSTGSGFDWNHGMNTSTFRFEQVSNSINVDNNSISVPSPYNSYNSWRVRTMIWDRTNNKNYLYINGDYIGFVNTPNTTGLSIYDGGGISLGTLYGWKHYGRRASFKIYNKILSADEIQQNFNIVKTKFGL